MHITQQILWKNIRDQQSRLRRRSVFGFGGGLPDDEEPEPPQSNSCLWEVIALILLIVFVAYMMNR